MSDLARQMHKVGGNDQNSVETTPGVMAVSTANAARLQKRTWLWPNRNRPFLTMPILSGLFLFFLLPGGCATVLCVCRPCLGRSISRKDTLPRQCLYRPQGITGRTTGCT